MSVWFTVLTIVFIVVSAAMVLIILVQRPQGGGLAGAFGGAGGTGTDTVFGGRVGDALTYMTVAAFLLYLGLAVGLNLMDAEPVVASDTDAAVISGDTPPLEGEATGSVPVTPVTPAPAGNPITFPTPPAGGTTDPASGTGDNPVTPPDQPE